MQFLQISPQAYSLSKYLAIPTVQAGSQITLVCLVCDLGMVQASSARSPTARIVIDFITSPPSMIFKSNYF